MHVLMCFKHELHGLIHEEEDKKGLVCKYLSRGPMRMRHLERYFEGVFKESWPALLLHKISTIF